MSIGGKGFDFENNNFIDIEAFWDRFKNGQTNVANYTIAKNNLDFQRENLEYQKALQQKIFDREDSAYQRTANDMRQAGLSPLIMNGTNGAGEAIQTSPLHNDFQMQDKGFGDILSQGSQIANAISKMRTDQANIDYINAQTIGQQTQNEFLPFSLGLGVIGQILSNNSVKQSIKNQTADYSLKFLQALNLAYTNEGLKLRNADAKRWDSYASQFGISSNMSEKERLLKFGQLLVSDNEKSPLKGVSDTVESFANAEKPGLATPFASIMPESWSKALEETLNKVAEKADNFIDKHGLRGKKKKNGK